MTRGQSTSGRRRGNMYITDLREDDIELSVKVVIVGNGAVGKSSMIQVR